MKGVESKVPWGAAAQPTSEEQAQTNEASVA
jgi:hypothetical protein